MSIGARRHFITIQHQTQSLNTYNQPIDGAWATFAQCWAEIRPLSGSEVFRSQQTISRANLLANIGYISGVTTKMKIQHGSRTLQIEHIENPSEANRELNLYCWEVVA